eukprot:519295-Pelagomonas_calceolata.AAC.1
MPPRGVGAGRAMPERISVSNTTKSRGVSNRISANSSALTAAQHQQAGRRDKRDVQSMRRSWPPCTQTLLHVHVTL